MPTAPPVPVHLLDVPQLAEHLGVPESHVRRLVQERRVPYVKWGRYVRFDPKAVNAWIEANTIEARNHPLPRRRRW